MLWTFVAGVVAAVAAVLVARPIGRALGQSGPVLFVIANVVAIALAVGVVFASTQHGVQAAAADALRGVGIGLGFGALTGLRHGRSPLHVPNASAAREPEHGKERA